MGGCVSSKQQRPIVKNISPKKQKQQRKRQTRLPPVQVPIKASKIDSQNGIILNQQLRKSRQKLKIYWDNPFLIKGIQKIKWQKISQNMYYKGQWKEDKMHGQGQVFANNNGYQRLIFVIYNEGRPITNNVKILDSVGGMYQGPINNLLQPQGEGKYINQKMSLVLEGSFKNGLPDGKVKQKCRQYEFQGEYKNGHKASGIMKDSKGIYEGDFGPSSQNSMFFEDVKNGYGKYKWQDGGTYIGQWQSDSPHGKGKLYDAQNSLVRQGKWNYGQMFVSSQAKKRPNLQQDQYMQQKSYQKSDFSKPINSQFQ